MLESKNITLFFLQNIRKSEYMQAIILAAGMGKRLKDLTKNNTKCMVRVNGVTLIERMLGQIDQKHLSRIIIVIGYEGQKLIDYIETLNVKTPIIYIDNPIYDRTNNIYSLSLAKDWLCKEDTLLFESDLIFEDSVLDALLEDDRESLALVDKYEAWMDGTCVKLNDDDMIEAFVPGNRFRFSEISAYYKTVNIYKFSKHFSETHYVPFLDAYQAALGANEYYEQVLRVITILDDPEIRAKRLDGQKWYEIDDVQDLDIAESIFTENDDERVALLQRRYGGYWRYPRLIDFCYLVNPFFPSEKLRDEMRANFDTLLTEYPSGMYVNSLLAAKNFGVPQNMILVGNGAAELIKALMENFSGVTGFIRPSFDEYINRYDEAESIYYIPNNSDYSYTVCDVIDYFSSKEIDNLVIINPDNPSGNYIFRKDIIRLIEWADKKSINLVVDESFADFSDEENNTLFDTELLAAHSRLFVVKSISKSYGVPGLRLGVLASGNTGLIEKLKKDVAIWNINSFAEFYMQIEEKYKKQYIDSLRRFRAERKRFETLLSDVPHVRVIPSQANFVMVELDNTISAKQLLKKLLIRHDLLIKELTTKANGRNYLRLAIRSPKDNDILIEAMKSELK